MQGAAALLRSRERRLNKANFKGSISRDELKYPHRLNLYITPPTEEISLEEFEQWAIDRLKVLSEIENSLFRNRTPQELDATLKPLLQKYIPLNSTSSIPEAQKQNPAAYRPFMNERKKDHYGHFILRLAFSRSEDLRRRFTKAEGILFKYRYNTADLKERDEFMKTFDMESETVSEAEKRQYYEQLKAVTVEKKNVDGTKLGVEKETFLKVDWERVPGLVEQRKVFLKGGKAYVPNAHLLDLVLAEFSTRLDEALEKTARALPRIDEDDRLIPILNHLSKGFTAPEYNTTSTASLNGTAITAGQIDSLSQHFPLCMRNLHNNLRRDKHLKHFGRLQYGLFLKGVGLSIDEAIIFWRTGFSGFTDDKFNKEYRYNIRHSYGLEGIRRNYKPNSCQQILTDHPPGPGEVHGCPYRHFSIDNLTSALSGMMGIDSRTVLSGVRQDVEAKKFHLACNRVFEFLHDKELKVQKDAGGIYKETIIHPNDYFDRSWSLKNPNAVREKGIVGYGSQSSQGVKTEEEEGGDVVMS